MTGRWLFGEVLRRVCGLILPLLCLLSPAAYGGSFACAVSSASGLSLTYDPASPAQTLGMGTAVITCTKSGANLATVYYELGINGGINLSGVQSRAVSGAYQINYNIWNDSARSQVWNDISSGRIKGSLASTSSSTVYVNYYVSIPNSQNVGVGTYLDTQTIKLYQGASAITASTDISPTVQTFGVALSVAAKCTLSSTPGDVNFNYTSFQTAASLASTSFAVTCMDKTSYSMALDSTTGTLLGLTYTLSLSKSGAQTGNGFAQSATINGSMPAGQSGTCNGAACQASEARTLTISY
jgi:spore coat protein U-like protein